MFTASVGITMIYKLQRWTYRHKNILISGRLTLSVPGLIKIFWFLAGYDFLIFIMCCTKYLTFDKRTWYFFTFSVLSYIRSLLDHVVLVTNLLLLTLFSHSWMHRLSLLANLLFFCFGWLKQSLVNTSHGMWARLGLSMLGQH